MRAQLRMPAYGRALFDERVAGRHPDGVWILAGDDWERRPCGLPSLCIGADWRPGSTDWRMLPLLPDGECQESSIDCQFNISERVTVAVLAVEKDASMQVIRAESAVRAKVANAR